VILRDPRTSLAQRMGLGPRRLWLPGDDRPARLAMRRGSRPAVLTPRAGVASSGVASDPHWSDVLLLLTGDSVDDKSSFARGTPTTVACSSTGAVIRLLAADDGGDNGSVLSFPAAANWSLGTGPFTYEFEAIVTRVPAGQTSLGGVWTQGGGTDGTWLVFYTGAALQTYTATPTTLRNNSSPNLSSASTHVAWVRDEDDTCYLYVGGVSVSSVGSMTKDINDATTPFRIGNFGTNLGVTADFNFVRLTRGVCRYPGGSTFTPPTAAEILATVP